MADHEWTAECVADHFEEAFRTLRKLPPVKAKGYFNVWPEIARTRREIAAMEPQPMRVWPSAPRSPGSSRPRTGCSGSAWRSASSCGHARLAFLGSRSAASWAATAPPPGVAGSWR